MMDSELELVLICTLLIHTPLQADGLLSYLRLWRDLSWAACTMIEHLQMGIDDVHNWYSD